ncbi:hypothetical protein [Nesterenkonia pannonica]|nr:hypothetical protein [Nesterenkonia pannonica]
MTPSASTITPSAAAGELWDAVIIGGGSAGLAASLALGRSCGAL